MYPLRSLIYPFVLFLFPLASAANNRVSVTLAGRQIELGLMRLEDRSLVDWPEGAIGLTTESIAATADFNLASRFASNGIDPDVSAYTLFYDLNPKITKASQISAGTVIVVPRISGANLPPQLNDGSHLVVLFVNAALRDELASVSDPLKGLAARFAQLPPERFPGPQERAAAISQSSELAEWYGVIRAAARQRKGPPLRLESLEQLRDEAGALAAILRTSTSSEARVSREEADQIAAIHRDVQREIVRYDEVMSGALPDSDLSACCAVTVNIRGDAKLVERMRVYYTLNGLFRRPPPGPIPGSVPFSQTGSGKSVMLRAKNYRFWTAIDEDPNRLWTAPLLVEVEPSGDGKPRVVELVIVPQAGAAYPKERGR